MVTVLLDDFSCGKFKGSCICGLVDKEKLTLP